MNTNRIIIGALLGGALAAASYSILSSKPGKKLRKNFLDNYHELGETVEDFVSDFKDNLANSVHNQTNDAWKKVASIKNELKSACDYESKETQQGLLIGALLGLVTGTLGTLAFQRETHENPCNPNNFLAQALKWKGIISQILETVEHKTEKPSQQGLGSKELLNLAVAGINLWQNRQKK
jgi:gas vesicle protein